MSAALPSPSRAAALLLMLLMHAVLLGLLQRPGFSPDPVTPRVELWLERSPPPRVPPPPPAPGPVSARTPNVPLPAWTAEAPRPDRNFGPEAPPLGEPSLARPTNPAAPSASPAPLNLSLPPPEARTRLPAIAEQLRHDPRANSPMPSAEERMAAALGAKGWTVLDLGEGSKKITGPFGECAIVRPSMVDGIAGHPHAGLLPNRVFPCGGIEKGSKVAARPHERKP